MNTMKWVPVFLLLVSPIFANAQGASRSTGHANHTNDEQAIRRLNEALLKAHQTGDVDTLDRIEDADFVVAGDFGEVPKRQHLDQVRHRGTDAPATLTVENAKIRFYGNAALLTEVEKYGSPAIEPGFETTSLWVRRGREWKAVHLHYSSLMKKP
jgi:ketosteroid isomerase-like protein